jgi:hypothetical protein
MTATVARKERQRIMKTIGHAAEWEGGDVSGIIDVRDLHEEDARLLRELADLLR